ncbi:hypothetical protein TIFTF001_021081 [Ficus carica]|uniref:Uncharacterized protein n=1 Tax=Ficus carica TaxID=3494 RepID=A0AA88A9U5_FICCA|nr:hypothetical protein TIFTF001_021081 [Ficus carica]
MSTTRASIHTRSLARLDLQICMEEAQLASMSHTPSQARDRSACQHHQAVSDPALRVPPCILAPTCFSELQHTTCPSFSALPTDARHLSHGPR